ncbi:hypothetical protein OG828_02630 [Streptomyces sp. NBC_00457]|uniref:hypothetical protein n=1 Tax=Streptomyces sp. NBC_00457 TaxID=2975748 RepID=UPI002E1B9C00
MGAPQPGRGLQPADGFAHHLLIRRSTEKKQLAGGRVDFEYAYFLVHDRCDAALPQAVCRAGVRWRIEENNQQAKQITGLGRYQVRRWNSWHRHVACAMIALAFLTGQRAQHSAQQVASENDAVPNHASEQSNEQGKAPPTREMSAHH